MSEELNYSQEELNFLGEREGSSGQGNFQDNKNIPSLHREILEKYIDQITKNTETDLKFSCLATNHYDGKTFMLDQQGLFLNGVDMSLWDVNKKLVLVSNSEDIFLVAAWKGTSWSTQENIDYIVTKQGADFQPWFIEFTHRANQNIEKSLRKWTSLNPKSVEAKDEYRKIASFKINGQKISSSWFTDKELQNPLLLLSYNIMLENYRKRKAFENNSVMQWSERNLNLKPSE